MKRENRKIGPTKAPSGSYWIVPGKLLGGAHPATRSLADTLRRIEMLVAHGVTSFIDLTEQGETAPYSALASAHAEGHGKALRYLRMPLPDHQIPPTPDSMNAILDYLEGELAAGQCVYLHCRAGIGRTGTVAGCHLIRAGMAPDQALEHLQRLWEEGGRTSVWPHTPETEEQTEYIRRWGTPEAMEGPSAPWWQRLMGKTEPDAN